MHTPQIAVRFSPFLRLFIVERRLWSWSKKALTKGSSVIQLYIHSETQRVYGSIQMEPDEKRPAEATARSVF